MNDYKALDSYEYLQRGLISYEEFKRLIVSHYKRVGLLDETSINGTRREFKN